MKKCSLCSDPVLARGWCRKHYLRWYKHGDPNFVPDRRDYIPRGKDSQNYKHGHWNHPLYGIWSHMIDRCDNPKEKAYPRYGGRGITVCERWYNIANFIADMGERPKGHSIDRIDNDKGYSPDNCRWADSTTQGRNRRCCKLTKELADAIRKEPKVAGNGRGEGMTRQQIADKYGVSVATVKKVRSGEYWQ